VVRPPTDELPPTDLVSSPIDHLYRQTGKQIVRGLGNDMAVAVGGHLLIGIEAAEFAMMLSPAQHERVVDLHQRLQPIALLQEGRHLKICVLHEPGDELGDQASRHKSDKSARFVTGCSEAQTAKRAVYAAFGGI
jgi:hypothetical protein